MHNLQIGDDFPMAATVVDAVEGWGLRIRMSLSDPLLGLKLSFPRRMWAHFPGQS